MEASSGSASYTVSLRAAWATWGPILNIYNNYKYPCPLLNPLVVFPCDGNEVHKHSGASQVTWDQIPALFPSSCSSASQFLPGPGICQAVPTPGPLQRLFPLKCPSPHHWLGQSSLHSSDLSPHTDCFRNVPNWQHLRCLPRAFPNSPCCGLALRIWIITHLYYSLTSLCMQTAVCCSWVVKNVSLATERLGIFVLQDVGMPWLTGVVSAEGFGCCGSTSAGTRAELNPWTSQATQWSLHRDSDHQGWNRALMCYCHTEKSRKSCSLQPARDWASGRFTLRPDTCFFPRWL